MDEIDFKSDDFADIVAKDARYGARAYALLTDVVNFLSRDSEGNARGHVTGEDILDEFKERALDQYGPLTYRVLTEWGVTCCEDIGEMMFNLADAGRVKRDDEDSKTSFLGGYDFKETFLGPYAV